MISKPIPMAAPRGKCGLTRDAPLFPYRTFDTSSRRRFKVRRIPPGYTPETYAAKIGSPTVFAMALPDGTVRGEFLGRTRWFPGRLYDRWKGRQAVLVCQELPEHPTLKIKAPRIWYTEESAFQFDPLRSSRSRKLAGLFLKGRLWEKDAPGIRTTTRVRHYKPGLEIGHRYEFVRYDAL